MTLDEKKARLQELKMELARLESGEKLRSQGAGLQAAAESMMVNDPMSAFDLMDKAAQTDIDRDKVMLMGQTKSRITQLEQLWKDATRALRQARVDRDQPSIKKYEEQVASLESQLATMAPDTWGTHPQNKTTEDGNIKLAVAEGNAYIDQAKDVNRDGKIDNVAKLEKDIATLVTKYNISEADIQEVHTYLQAKKDEIAGLKEGALVNSDEARRQASELDRRIDTKYPDIRKSITTANALLRIIPEGDRGLGSARNEAVKKLSRMASDEALTASDFGQALGRSGILSTLTEWTKTNVNVTDAEWSDLKTRLNSAIDGVRSRRTQAVRDFSGADKALEQVNTPSNNKNTRGGLKTANVNGITITRRSK